VAPRLKNEKSGQSAEKHQITLQQIIVIESCWIRKSFSDWVAKKNAD